MRFRARGSIAAAMAIGLSICLSSGALAARGWTGPTALTHDSITSLLSLHVLASDGTRLHIVLGRSDPETGEASLIHRRSLDAGRTWEPERILFTAGPRLTEVASNVSVAARGDTVVALFRSHDATHALLFTRTSRDGGSTWGSRVRIDRATTTLKLGVSGVTITPAGIVVAWTVRSTGHIFTSRSADGGVTFSQPQIMATTSFDFACGNPDYRDGLVAIGSDGMSVDLAWSDERNTSCGADKLYLRRSVDGGLTWKPRQLVPTVAGGTNGWPEMAVRGNTVLMLLDPLTSGQLLLRSTDRGRTFHHRLLDAGPTTSSGDIAFEPDGSALVTFPEIALSETGEVASSRLVTLSSSDGGASWSKPRLAQAASQAIFSPNLAFIGQTPVIAFERFTSPEFTADIFATTGTGDRQHP